MVGANVANHLRKEGYTVRAAVRDPSAEKNEFLRAMGCELVRVPDLLSDDGWAEALGAGRPPDPEERRSGLQETRRSLQIRLRASGPRRIVSEERSTGERQRGHGSPG